MSFFAKGPSRERAQTTETRRAYGVVGKKKARDGGAVN
jgi:hypothetical protein